MPSRVVWVTCKCWRCTETGGTDEEQESIGVRIRKDDLDKHLAESNALRLRARSEQAVTDAYVDQVTSSIMALALHDESPTSTPLSSAQLPPTSFVGEIPSLIHVLSEIHDSPSVDDLALAFSTMDIDGLYPTRVPLGKYLTKMGRRIQTRELHRSTQKAKQILLGVQRCVREARASACACLDTDGMPTPQNLTALEACLLLQRGVFESVTRNSPSVNSLRLDIAKELNAMEAEVDNWRSSVLGGDGPIPYDTANFHSPDIDRCAPIAQVTTFLAVFCSVIICVGRRYGDFIVGCLKFVVASACSQSNTSPHLQSNIVDQIPNSIGVALDKFKLDGETTVFAVCELCNCTYGPKKKRGLSKLSYPQTCTNIPSPGYPACGASLLKPKVQADGSCRSVPRKQFVYHHFRDYIASLLSRPDIEGTLELAMDKVVGNLGVPAVMHDVMDGEFVRTFLGPDKAGLFAVRSGESRLLFSLNCDFFNVNTNLMRGASASTGLISMACLNLPPDVRYKYENMYVAGLVPGPREPPLTQLNHYLRPLVDELLDFWQRGFRFSKTSLHSRQIVRCAIACCVCDLPAAKKIAGLAAITSNTFCHICSCKDRIEVERVDCEHPDWRVKDRESVLSHATAWKNAESVVEQERIFKAYGVRWSELWRLPYWNPATMLVVDPMHCLFENFVHRHFRRYLGLTTAAATAKQAVPSAFEHPFTPYEPDNETLLEQVEDIDKLLQQNTRTSSKEAAANVLFDRIQKKTRRALLMKCQATGLNVVRRPGSRSAALTKADFAWTLSLHAAELDLTNSVPLREDPPPDKVTTDVKAIHTSLTASFDDTDDRVQFESLRSKLSKKLLTALQHVCSDLDITPAQDPRVRVTRLQLADVLVHWRSRKPLRLQAQTTPKTTSLDVLIHIRSVIKETAIPSWVRTVPKEFGESRTGVLKADEWRTLSTIHLPLALVTLWGEGYSSDPHLRLVLDHTMHLVQAVLLVARRSIATEDVAAYQNHMKAYIEDLTTLHKDARRTGNQHMGLHLPHFVNLFGPVYSWWTYAFERLIGHLQRLPSNGKFGELEATLLNTFIRASRLRQWISRIDNTAAIKYCRTLLLKAFPPTVRGTDTDRGTAEYDNAFDDEGDYNMQASEPEAEYTVSQPEAEPLLMGRGRISIKGVTYSTFEAHQGNSLCMYYPNGSQTPVAGEIQSICGEGKSITVTLRRHKQVSKSSDPFAYYPDFPARLYSADFYSKLDVVSPSRISSHVARWKVSNSVVVILKLSRH